MSTAHDRDSFQTRRSTARISRSVVTRKRAIGPIMRHKALNADLVRTIHGFDALLVLTGSTALANL